MREILRMIKLRDLELCRLNKDDTLESGEIIFKKAEVRKYG
jgi:hypothetical protein